MWCGSDTRAASDFATQKQNFLSSVFYVCWSSFISMLCPIQNLFTSDLQNFYLYFYFLFLRSLSPTEWNEKKIGISSEKRNTRRKFGWYTIGCVLCVKRPLWIQSDQYFLRFAKKSENNPLHDTKSGLFLSSWKFLRWARVWEKTKLVFVFQCEFNAKINLFIVRFEHGRWL